MGVGAHVSAPVVADVLAQLPLLDIAINERLGFVGAFAVAVLAGLGVDAWQRESSGRRLAALLAAVAGILAALLAWQRPSMLAAGLSASFIAEQSWWLLLPPAIGAIAITVRPRAAVAVAALLALAAGQRLGEIGDLYPTLPAEAFAPVVAPIGAIPPSEAPFRIVGELGTFTPNLSAFYGLEDVRGYQAMNHRRRRLTDALWSVEVPVWSNRVDDLTDPFLRFLNVRFAFQNRSRPVPNGWRLVAHGRGCRLLENPRSLERAFVPRRVVVGMEAPQILAAMAEQRNFARLAWIEAAAPVGRRPRPEPNGPGTVRVSRRGSGLDLSVQMERAGWVVISQTAWRGWRARSAGRDLPLEIANVAYLGLHLEAGRHDVELRYLPTSFVAGLIITTATGLVLLAGLMVARIARRRPSAAGRRAER
jgi:hypothetical protein